MRSTILGFFSIALLSSAAIAGDVGSGASLGSVRYDWNRDGFIDRAEIFQESNDDSVQLHVRFGRRGGGLSPPIIAKGFAGSTPTIGDPAHIKLNALGSIVVESSHIGVGRGKYEASTIVAFREGHMRVIGYEISNWDSLDPKAATRCDVNFLNGRANIVRAGESVVRTIRHRNTPIRIVDWAMLPEFTGTCPAS
jgi:hypothetical protein